MARVITATQDLTGSLLRNFFDANGGYSRFTTNEIGALTELTKYLVGSNLWDKMIAIYPFVGRSSVAHSYNIKNLSQYQITWSGSSTHNQFGVTGTGGYGLTNIPLNIFANKTDDIHISAYNRTDIVASTISGRLIGVNSLGLLPNIRDIGAQELNFSTAGGIIGYCYGESQDSCGFGRSNADITGVSGKGLMIGNNSNKCYLNGADFGSAFPLRPSIIHENCQRSLILLGNRYEGSILSSARVNIAFASVGFGLSSLDISNLTQCVERFQAALFRSAL